MKARLRVFLAGLILGSLAAIWWFTREPAEPLPDEKKVAMELLTDTQSGPDYFHAGDPAPMPDERGIVWLDPLAAREQIDRVAEARKLDAAGREKLARLIEETCEPHPSRVVGGDRINLARLNVALDAMR